MRSRSLLLATALALAVPLAAVPALAIIGGTESTQAYSFMGSLQPSFPAPPRPDHAGRWRPDPDPLVRAVSGKLDRIRLGEPHRSGPM